MKVLIYCKVWKRLKITQVCYLGILRIQKLLHQFNIESDVLIVCSESDHEALASKFGFRTLHTDNSPLGMKQNLGLVESLNYEWDYMLHMDSNNLLTDAYVDRWVVQAMMGTPQFGSNVFHILRNTDVTRFNCKPNTLSGVGRGLSRQVLEDTYQKLGKLCDTGIKKGLDSSTRRLIEKATGIKCTLLYDKDELVILDIKSGEDLNKHTIARGAKKSDITVSDLKKHFPELKHLDL